MNNGNTDITKDLKNIINDYMTKAIAEEFIKVIEAENSSGLNEVLNILKSDIPHVEYKLPNGIDYRLLVDPMITHCQPLLT